MPQYILEQAWESGKGCRVICSQPRRLSVVSVSTRVAEERAEPIGTTVGYTIRLESTGGPHSSLQFVTAGVLLRMLSQGDEVRMLATVGSLAAYMSQCWSQ